MLYFDLNIIMEAASGYCGDWVVVVDGQEEQEEIAPFFVSNEEEEELGENRSLTAAWRY